MHPDHTYLLARIHADALIAEAELGRLRRPPKRAPKPVALRPPRLRHLVGLAAALAGIVSTWLRL